MNEPLLIHDSQGYHVRLNGTWHHGLTRDESRRLLMDGGIHIHDAYLLVESAPWWPDPVEVQYKPPGRRRWTVDGRPVTREGAAWTFREVGMTYAHIARLMRICRLCYEIEQQLPPPPSDSMSEAEFRRALADGLARALSVRVARNWARERLRPAQCKHPLSVCGWKDRFERDNPKRRLTRDDFIQALKEAGVPVIGDDVFATEIHS